MGIAHRLPVGRMGRQPGHARLELAVSARQFHQAGFVDMVRHALR
jgi:hypothetical protein